MIVATYGYSRTEFAPRKNPQEPIQCRLNSFSAQRDYDGKLPIYVDEVPVDALLLSLNPDRVHSWLERNGFEPPNLPRGTDSNLSRRAYFVQLFNDAPLRETLQADRSQARMVFGLLHTLSHLCVRQAALLCGLDRTSLSEYMLPRALTFAIYCNHRSGATSFFNPKANMTDEQRLGSHAKFCVADGQWAYVGSTNLTGPGLSKHLEMGLLVQGNVARQIEDFWRYSVEIELFIPVE